MRGWQVPVFLLAVGACSSDPSSPGSAPDVPTDLSSTTLDRAIALTWNDNAFAADPGNFRNYRIYSTSYNLDADQCGTSWGVEGTTVAPEFLVGALTNGVSRCFAVTSVSVDGAESGRSLSRADTPRPDARNQLLYTIQALSDSSGFRFWEDNGDGVVQTVELGLPRPGTSTSIDFFVDRHSDGRIFLTPVRTGTGVEFYAADPVEDLTSIDFAPCLPGATPTQCGSYAATPIQASPGLGYVFEMDAGDGFLRYAALRMTHVGQTFVIFDWAFQTDPGNPELMVVKQPTRVLK
jgi:hypothetical protein